MTRQNIIILVVGIFLIFISLYVFTRPAIFDSWNFSNSGQIGDTIGGITAPVINLIGAFLVYISFKSQIDANRIQSKALEDEKMRNSANRLYEKYLLQFDEIKNSLRNMEFVVDFNPIQVGEGKYEKPIHITYTGLNALNEYVDRLENPPTSNTLLGPHRYYGQNYNSEGIYLNFQFMLNSIFDLINRADETIENKRDREFLHSNIKLFYIGFLKQFGERILKHYSFDEDGMSELKIIKEKIDKKIGA